MPLRPALARSACSIISTSLTECKLVVRFYQFTMKPGDSWCVCARTWLAAVNAGSACPVDLEATHEEALSIIPYDLLETHAV